MQLLQMIQLLRLAQGICGEPSNGLVNMSMFQSSEPVNMLS